MADNFALAFRRYWMIIVTVAISVVYAGSQLQALLDADAALRTDVRVLFTLLENLDRDRPLLRR